MICDDPYIKHGERDPRQDFHKGGATNLILPSKPSIFQSCLEEHTVFFLFGIAPYQKTKRSSNHDVEYVFDALAGSVTSIQSLAVEHSVSHKKNLASKNAYQDRD